MALLRLEAAFINMRAFARARVKYKDNDNDNFNKWPLNTILHTNFIMLQIMPIMLNYAVYANLCLRGAKLYAKFAKLC